MNQFFSIVVGVGAMGLLAVAGGVETRALAQAAGAATTNAAPAATPARTRNTTKWNLASETKLAISGFDPVAYFPEGGGKATKGDAKFTSTVKGATYRFASADHKKLFDADPSKFEPSHGGWCSWAMREGDRVEVDPESFLVKDGRLFLFYNGWLGDTRSKWSKGNHVMELTEADGQWLKYSGEQPPAAAMAPTAPAAPAAPATPATDVKLKPVSATVPPPALQTKLSGIREKYESRAPAAAIEKSSSAIKTVADSGILTTALQVGATAPDFELSDVKGEKKSLKAMLAQGPVVVTFYRGSWCPFCTAQLAAYQDVIGEIKATGAQLVAISPELMDGSKSLAESMKLEYSILADTGNVAAKKFGVSYVVPESVAPMYKPLLKKANGDESGELPLAATYVIDRTGKVAYAFVNADYRVRAEPSDVLAALRALDTKK